MPYRAKKAIHSDVNPSGKTFDGQLLNESDARGNFVIVGTGGILSNADAEKFGLVDSVLVEEVTSEQIKQEIEDRNAATYDRDKGNGVTVIAPVQSGSNDAEKSAKAKRK